MKGMNSCFTNNDFFLELFNSLDLYIEIYDEKKKIAFCP